MIKDTMLWGYLVVVTLWFGVLQIFVGAKGTGRGKDDGSDFP